MAKYLMIFYILLDLVFATKNTHLNMKSEQFKITNVTVEKAIIQTDKLIVGQSGIIIHKLENNRSIIIANGIVNSISNNKTVLNLSKWNNLSQDALPNTKQKPKNGDIFVVNHVYNSSLLIVPNNQAFELVKNLYPKQNFLNPDIFASKLKINYTAIPTKDDMRSFCKSYDIGTIFLVANNNLYIVDVNSLKLLDMVKLNNIIDNSEQSPFYTKVEKIENGFFSLSDDKIEDYNKYYVKLLGLKR